jgi:hypothetical protein
MSKSLRSRPIDFCLEENGNIFEVSKHRTDMDTLPSGERVGVTSYSGVRSLRDLLIGYGCAGFPMVMFSRPPPPPIFNEARRTRRKNSISSPAIAGEDEGGGETIGTVETIETAKPIRRTTCDEDFLGDLPAMHR